MSKLSLSRRTVLRGAAGAALALPVLDAMLDTNGAAYAADGDPIPKRYAICFGGFSLGSNGGSTTTPTWADGAPKLCSPQNAGPLYDVPRALQPIQAMRSDITVVSRLHLPSAEPLRGASAVPPAGKVSGHHGYMMRPLLSGMRHLGEPAWYDWKETSDQIVAGRIAGTTTFKSLQYMVQVSSYLVGYDGYDVDNLMSVKRDATGNLGPLVPQHSPQLAWRALTNSFVPPDPAEALRKAKQRARRLSVLDLVRDSAARLKGRVGATDKQRIEQHFTEVRDLEQRINALPPPTAGACSMMQDPGADPPPGVSIVYNPADMTTDLSATNGYGSEELRANLMCDLIRMAFACDLTRVVSMLMTEQQSFLNLYSLYPSEFSSPLAVHDASHAGNGVEIAVCAGWHYGLFAGLVKRLKETPEGAGNVLDNSALVFVSEGGWGYTPENGEQSPHSCYNMQALIAGRAGGLKPGKHVIAAGKHPASVTLSAMKAVDPSIDALGEVTETIPELFT